LLQFYDAVFLMLAVAWVMGEVAHRLGQASLVGQLLGGVLIGPAVLNLVQTSADLTVLENIGLFFIMLLTGLTVKPREISAAGSRAAVVSLVSFLIPFAAGTEIAHLFGADMITSLVVGLAISITAVPVNAIILMELGILDTKLGQTVIAAGVIDDIVAFIVLAVIQEYAAGHGGFNEGALLVTAGEAVAFLAVVFVADMLIRSRITWIRARTAKLSPHIRAPGSAFIGLVTFAVGISLLAQSAGLQFVIGAFFAGLILGEVFGAESLGKANDVFHGVTFGFFAPIAFAFIGLEFVVPTAMGLEVLGALLAAAFASKFFGGYVGARAVGFIEGESRTIGFLMNSRGFVELVVSTTAFQLGLIDQAYFSLVVCIGIITTVVSPIASRIALRKMREAEALVIPEAHSAGDGVAAPQRHMLE
jgi:Kef-type K+ transport system membrane component KefB